MHQMQWDFELVSPTTLTTPVTGTLPAHPLYKMSQLFVLMKCTGSWKSNSARHVIHLFENMKTNETSVFVLLANKMADIDNPGEK